MRRSSSTVAKRADTEDNRSGAKSHRTLQSECSLRAVEERKKEVLRFKEMLFPAETIRTQVSNRKLQRKMPHFTLKNFTMKTHRKLSPPAKTGRTPSPQTISLPAYFQVASHARQDYCPQKPVALSHADSLYLLRHLQPHRIGVELNQLQRVRLTLKSKVSASFRAAAKQ